MAILQIPITKAGNITVTVNTDIDVPDDMVAMVWAEGLKVCLNRGMSKVESLKGLNEDEAAKTKAAALEIANKNLEKLRASKLTKGRVAATSTTGNKIPGPVVTEARRLAKEVVKNEIRAAGLRPSLIPAADLTKYANELLAKDPSYYEQAAINIESRAKKVEVGATDEETKAKAAAKLAELGFAGESPKLKAKADKAKADKPLSAKQAGMVKAKAAPRKGAAPIGLSH